MGIFNKLFGKSNEKQKPVAVAFVDYEHWYISMVKLFGEKPDIQGWVKTINKTYDLKEIIFFADFSNNTLAREINRIREVSSNIVQTANTSQNHKKDFTDFIMLDHIYQRAMSADGIDTFIIFSGDGHFSSVASYLKNVRKKDVGVCGVRDAFSHQLKNSASWSVEIPDDRLLYGEYYKMILDNLKRIEGNGWKKTSVTFEKTVDAVSTYYQVSAEKISRALISLINQDYVIEHEEYTGDGKKLLALEICWSKLLRDGIWQPSENSRRSYVSANRSGNAAQSKKASASKQAKSAPAAKENKSSSRKKTKVSSGKEIKSSPAKETKASPVRETLAPPDKQKNDMVTFEPAKTVPKKASAAKGTDPKKIATPTVFEMPKTPAATSGKKGGSPSVKSENAPSGKPSVSEKSEKTAASSKSGTPKASVKVIYPVRPAFSAGTEEPAPPKSQTPVSEKQKSSEKLQETVNTEPVILAEIHKPAESTLSVPETVSSGSESPAPKKKKKKRYYYPKKTANAAKKS